MAEIAIVGIGNPFRGDDGAGWAVIDALEKRVDAKIKLSKTKGDMGDLLDYFANFRAVFLVDACKSDASPGTWQRLDALSDTLPNERAQTSTHGFSINEAISLGKALDQLPSKLIIYAVNGDLYNIGGKLSLAVAQSIGPIVESILKDEDIQACMKKV